MVSLTLDTKEFSRPNCPKCNKKLYNIISDMVLCSSPPWYAFKCSHCGFKGHVHLDWSKKRKKEWKKLAKDKCVKFSDDRLITNEEWLLNLKTSMAGVMRGLS